MITYFAYGLFIFSLIIKCFALYLLAGNPEKPFAERQKAYKKFNLPANILITIGIGILLYQWYY